MEQDYLDFSTGDVIAFVLTVFSTVLAIVPLIELPSSDHSSDEIYRLRAAYTIINSSINNHDKNQPNQLLWAYNKLSDPSHVIYYYKKNFPPLDYYSYPYYYFGPNETNRTKIDANLAMTVENYNNDTKNRWQFITDSKPYLQNLLFLSAGNTYNDDLQNEIWYTRRIVNLENPSFDPTEDATCAKIRALSNTFVCSFTDLKNMTKKIDDLSQVGFISNIYDTNQRVHAIENPVETYVNYLTHFIIISLIAGPITYLAVERFYVRKGTESIE
jgi:hypothetical protein